VRRALVIALAVVLALAAQAPAKPAPGGIVAVAAKKSEHPTKRERPSVRARAWSAGRSAKKRAAARKRACLRRARTRKARSRCVRAAKRKPVAVSNPVAPATQVPVPVVAPDAAHVPVPVVAAPVEPTPAPVVPPCDPSPWLLATAEDGGGFFRLRLSRSCVPAGRVLLNYVNKDAQPHNLWLEGVAPAVPGREVIDDVEGPGSASGSAQLAAGTWRLYCAIDGHEAMTKTIEVTLQ
jgi:hypothetical protein